MNVSIIGGAGHVGMSMGLVLAHIGHSTCLIDKDEQTLKKINEGELPFREKGGERLLQEGLSKGLLSTATELDPVADSDVVIISVGTPIDEHNNPQMDNLLDVVNGVTTFLREDQLIVLRSTVYPGTTENVRKELEDGGYILGNDLYLSYAPERITQHNAIEEIIHLPQLIGTFEDASYERSVEFFSSFLESDCYRLSPTEAELGKLFTNMWRYITFAIANEFYYISESFVEFHDVNVHRILDKTQRNYPRFDPPTPGANVGGPCLTKDGWFLVDNIPFNELVSTAFQINEGMPSKIIERLDRLKADPDKIVLLGMTFKADSDDTRNSVAFKMEKQLALKGFRNVVRIEPNVEGYDKWSEMEDADWIILMTPHSQFEDLTEIYSTVDNEDALFCDVWGFWEQMSYESENGFFTGNMIEENQLTETA